MSLTSFSVDVPKSQLRSGESFFLLESAKKGQDLQFIQHRSVKDSQRQKELRMSDLRAHAARIAHHNKRKKQAQKIAEEQESKDNSKTQKAIIPRKKSPLRPPSPLIPALSQSSRDPLNTTALSTVPSHLLDLLDIAYTNFSEAFRPPIKGSHYPDVLTWRKELVSYPAISYSIIAGAATMSLTDPRRLSSSQRRELTQARLEYTSLAVAQVRKELRDPTKATSDPLLFAILCLGSHEDVEQGEEEEDISQQIISPLSMGSFLQVFMRLKMSAIHFDALIRLLELKGGLSKVKIPVWREIMSYLALVWATKRGARPQLPFVDSLVVTLMAQDTENNSDGLPTPGPSEMIPEIPDGFANALEVCKDSKLEEALKYAAQITQYVEQIIRNTSSPNEYQVINLRNKTQYSLTSLEPKLITADSNINACLYEICRLSALEFSDMVIFPSPALTKVRRNLASRLLNVLVSPQIQKEEAWKEHAELLGWATMIGAVASLYVPENKEAFMCIFSQKTMYADSQDCLTSLRRFLWSDLLTDRTHQVWVESLSYKMRRDIQEADVQTSPH